MGIFPQAKANRQRRGLGIWGQGHVECQGHVLKDSNSDFFLHYEPAPGPPLMSSFLIQYSSEYLSEYSSAR